LNQVEAVFAFTPILVFALWPAPRAHVLAALRRQPCRWRTQLAVGLALGIGSFLGAAVLFELYVYTGVECITTH